MSFVTEHPDWQIHGDERPLPPLLGEVKDLALVELHNRMAEEGHPAIRPGHGCVFRFIAPEGARLTDIAERARMTKQAVGEVVADLERLGYVERVPDPDDRRAKIIRLTDRGWDAERTGREIFADIERRWAEQIGEERMAELRDTLKLVIESQRAAAVG